MNFQSNVYLFGILHRLNISVHVTFDDNIRTAILDQIRVSGPLTFLPAFTFLNDNILLFNLNYNSY